MIAMLVRSTITFSKSGHLDKHPALGYTATSLYPSVNSSVLDIITMRVIETNNFALATYDNLSTNKFDVLVHRHVCLQI
jgi:hypothetical protein